MSYEFQIEKILKTLLKDTQMSDHKVSIIKHCDNFDFSKDAIERTLGESNASYFLMYHTYETGQMQEAYEPFLAWIKELYERFYKNSMSVEAFLEACNVYPLQREVLSSYITDGFCTRREEVLETELLYEKKRFLQSLVQIFQFFAKDRQLFFILNKLHLANESAIRLMLCFFYMTKDTNISILAAYNELAGIPVYMTETWEKLISETIRVNQLYEWETVEHPQEMDMPVLFNPKAGKVDTYIKELNNMLHTFAFSQMDYYMTALYQKMEWEKFLISNEARMRIIIMYALEKIYSGKADNALMIIDTLTFVQDSINNLHMQYSYYYIKSLAHTSLFQEQIAKENALKCLEISKQLQDEILIMKAEILLFIGKYNGWKNLFTCNFTYEIQDDLLIKKLEKAGFTNTLAYVYAFGFDNQKQVIEELAKNNQVSPYVQKGLELGYQTTNTNFLMNAYAKNIFLYTDAGYYEIVSDFCRKRLELARLEQDKVKEADMFNGLGYNYIIAEQYIQANTYFNNAIRNAYDSLLPERCAEALYNMVINCMSVGNYKQADEYLETVLIIMDNLQLLSIHACNIAKIYGLAALCNYKLGLDYKCYYYQELNKKILHPIMDSVDDIEIRFWCDSLFLYYFVQGLLQKKELTYKEALISLKKAGEYQEGAQGSKFFTCVMYAKELADLYTKMGQPKKAQKELNTCIAYCRAHGYQYKEEQLERFKEHKEEKGLMQLPLNDVSLDDIVLLSETIEDKINLEKKKKEIQFLSYWQELINRDIYSEDELITSAMSMLTHNFHLTGVIYWTMEEKKERLLFCSEKEIFEKLDIEQMIEYFLRKPQPFIINCIDPDYDYYMEIIKGFGTYKLSSLIGIPIMENEEIQSVLLAYVKRDNDFLTMMNHLGNDEVTIMNFAIGQLNMAVDQLRTREKLEVMNGQLKEHAVRDLLTGLYNRQGFLKIVQEVKNHCADNVCYAVIYIDLDNFKYYNDTFGHEIGDLILVEFSKIFKEIVKNAGYAFRYGGDEFILLLINQDENDAVAVAEKIYQMIDAGFKEEIEKKLNRKIQIPVDRKITCSMGIAAFHKFTEEKLMDAITLADHELYKIKKSVKGHYKVCESIE